MTERMWTPLSIYFWLCGVHTEPLNTSSENRHPRDVFHKSGFGLNSLNPEMRETLGFCPPAEHFNVSIRLHTTHTD